jgi:hypothetical protein
MAARSVDTTDPGVQVVGGVDHSRFRSDGLDMRYRLDVVALSVLEVVTHAGGWLFDRVTAGWDVTVRVADDHANERPLQILGAQTLDFDDALASLDYRPRPHALAVATDLFGSDLRVRQGLLKALDDGLTEVTLWGETWPAELDDNFDSVQHRLSAAARVFKAHALAATATPNASVGFTESFRSRLIACPSTGADLVPARRYGG